MDNSCTELELRRGSLSGRGQFFVAREANRATPKVHNHRLFLMNLTVYWIGLPLGWLEKRFGEWDADQKGCGIK